MTIFHPLFHTLRAIKRRMVDPAGTLLQKGFAPLTARKAGVFRWKGCSLRGQQENHGSVTVIRMNIHRLLPMGALKVCWGGTPVSVMGVQLPGSSVVLHSAP